MKKFISILLSLALLLSCAAALAETAEKETLGTLSVNGEFTIQAPVPEGYKMTIKRADETRIIAYFEPEDKIKPVLQLSVGLQDSWEPGSKLNNISDQDLAEIEASFYWDDPDFEISYSETEHGTKLLLAQLPDKSQVVIYTLYEGYEIEFTLQTADETGLTQEQIDACIKVLSDMDFVAPESAKLPGYVYPDPDQDPVFAAITNYMINNDFGYTAEAGGVLIPAPIVLKEDISEDGTKATVYGNFWIFAYKLNGTILECTAGGENPGIINLEKKDGEWVVTSAEYAGDGEEYKKSITKFANGDADLEKEYYAAGDASEGYLPQYLRSYIIGYVQLNGLENIITAYQDYGQDPVLITD